MSNNYARTVTYRMKPEVILYLPPPNCNAHIFRCVMLDRGSIYIAFMFLIIKQSELPFYANNTNQTTTYMRCGHIRLVTSCSDMRRCMGRCRHRLGPNWISCCYTTSLGTLATKRQEMKYMNKYRVDHEKYIIQ